MSKVEDYNENYRQGWVSLYRSIKNHWLFDNDKWFKWWVLMLFEVNHSQKKFTLGYNIYNIESGQSANSLRTWSKIFNTTPKTVDSFFKLLQKDKMILRKTLGKGKQSTTLITIENYNGYQAPSKHKVNIKETQGKRKGGTNNNYNNYNNDNNIINFEKLLLFINSKTNRNFQVINKTIKSKYKARLKDGYTNKDILIAIVNAVNSDYHKETNFKYLTPEFFSRATTIDKYSNTTEQDSDVLTHGNKDKREAEIEFVRKLREGVK